MQNKDLKLSKGNSEQFRIAVQNARLGDKEAMENIMELFKDDINIMCRFISAHKEDVIQELYAELLSIVMGRKYLK